MWKRTDSSPTPEPQPRSAPPSPSPSPTPAPAASSGSGSPRQPALIGASIRIRGELSGSEDLLIQGSVDGEVQLAENRVTIGAQGRVQADVHGKVIEVQGRVEGNLYASDQIVVRQSGEVLGNITAPRVSLEDGATFKGSIDMAARGSSGSRSTPPGSSASSAASSSSGPAQKGNGQTGGAGGKNEARKERSA